MSQNPSTGQAAQTAKSAVMRTTKIPSFVLLLVLGGLQLLALPNGAQALDLKSFARKSLARTKGRLRKFTLHISPSSSSGTYKVAETESFARTKELGTKFKRWPPESFARKIFPFPSYGTYKVSEKEAKEAKEEKESLAEETESLAEETESLPKKTESLPKKLGTKSKTWPTAKSHPAIDTLTRKLMTLAATVRRPPSRRRNDDSAALTSRRRNDDSAALTLNGRHWNHGCPEDTERRLPITNVFQNRLFHVFPAEAIQREIKSLDDLLENCENPRIFEVSFEGKAYQAVFFFDLDVNQLVVAYENKHLSAKGDIPPNISSLPHLATIFPSIITMARLKRPGSFGRMLLEAVKGLCEESTEAHGTVYKPNRKWYTWYLIRIRVASQSDKALWMLAINPTYQILISFLKILASGASREGEEESISDIETWLKTVGGFGSVVVRKNPDESIVADQDDSNSGKSRHKLDIYSSLIRLSGREENPDEKRREAPNSDQPIKELPSHLLESFEIGAVECTGRSSRILHGRTEITVPQLDKSKVVVYLGDHKDEFKCEMPKSTEWIIPDKS